MNLDALSTCFSSASCLVTQTSTALILGMLLFLVASGLTLIFGVPKLVRRYTRIVLTEDLKARMHGLLAYGLALEGMARMKS